MVICYRSTLDALSIRGEGGVLKSGAKVNDGFPPCSYCGDTVDNNHLMLLINNEPSFYCSPECIFAANQIELARDKVAQ